MTREERLVSIDKFEGAYSLIEALVSDLSDAALDFIPAEGGAWSIKEHLVHLLDGESAVYFRLRMAVAQPGSVVQMWDEEAWHSKLAYGSASARSCLEVAKSLRATVAASLRAIVDEDWSVFWLQHPERGRLELERLVELYREHIAYHVPYIKRNREAWKQLKR